jgi:PRC-barrel domain
MVEHHNLAEWHGKDLVDRNGKKIGKLEDVYVDVETDEPMFGTVKEGLFARHLAFCAAARAHDRPRQPPGGGLQGASRGRPQLSESPAGAYGRSAPRETGLTTRFVGSSRPESPRVGSLPCRRSWVRVPSSAPKSPA